MSLAQIASNLSEYPPLEVIEDNSIPTQQQLQQDPSDEWGDNSGGSFDFDDQIDFSLFAAGMSLPTKPFSISPLADEEEDDDYDEDDEEDQDDDEEDSITPRSPTTAAEKRPDIKRLYEALQQGYLDVDTESMMDMIIGK